MALKIAAIKSSTLKSSLSAAASSVILRSFKDRDDNAVTLSTFGEWGTIVVKNGDVWECIKFDGVANNSDGSTTLTVATNGRHVLPVYPYTGGSTGFDFAAGSEVIVTNDPLIMSTFGNMENTQTWNEVQTFAALPKTTAGNPVDDTDLARKAYVDAVVAGTYPTNRIVVSGTAGETLAAGNLVYLKSSDGRWWKCDADDAATVENVLLGIAQGAGTAGAAISDGVLIRGYDNHQTGLTASNIYYASNTAGGIANSAGTKEVTIGFSISTTELYFSPGFNQQITEDQQDALAGDAGTPSAATPFVTTASPLLVPTGAMLPYAGITAPTGFLMCDGSAVSRSTYSALFSILNPTLGTVTISIASPGVVTKTSHGLYTGDSIYLTTTGALPTGLSANTRYWVTRVDADTFKLATSQANALASTNINTSGSQSGTHTANQTMGVGDGSTTFNVPDMQGYAFVGRKTSDTEFAGRAMAYGEKTHTLTTDEIPAHTHSVNEMTGGSGYGNGGAQQPGATTTGSTGGGSAHNNIQPSFIGAFIIKT